MDEHKYVSGVRIHSGETGPRCVVCGEPEANWRHVPSVVFGDKPAHEFATAHAKDDLRIDWPLLAFPTTPKDPR